MFALLVAAVTLLGVANCQFPVAFSHGVASGDPTYERIILWTRVTPRVVNISDATRYNVTWTVYSGVNLTNPVQAGVVPTNASKDFTVKVDVGGLRSGVQYAFRFQVDSVVSDVGTFRLPVPPGQRLESLSFFTFSCSNFMSGYFNAYDIASRYNLDFWVHLGDYYYEYASNASPPPNQAVRWQPAPQGIQPQTEIQSLEDYRLRHATYRTDRGLQALTASAPLIALWDDHETLNNVYSEGGDNQNPGELDFPLRKANAVQAYREWMPIRDDAMNPVAINRTLQFGDLATIFVLEDRLTARTNSGADGPPGDPNNVPSAASVIGPVVNGTIPANWGQNITDKILEYKNYVDTRRTGANETMLGADQEADLARETNAASSPGPNQTIWQQYMGGLVMMDRMPADYEGGIAAARRRGDIAKADLWQQVLNNLTLGTPGATYTSYSPTPYTLGNYSKSFPVTQTQLTAYRTNVALGRYKIATSLDSWVGYIADRNRFLTAIENATNPVVYGGDSHNFWGGYVYKVDPQDYFGLNKTTPIAPGQAPAAVEFDNAGVTSTGSENGAIVPLDFITESFKAASPGMVFSAIEYKGGVFVNLTRTNEHVEYIYVNTIATQDYTAFCGQAYDVPARTNKSTPQVITPGRCGPIPEARPYQKNLILSEETRVVPGNVSLPTPPPRTSGVQTAG
jgi:phosphodiesterase/alkaline phosphatase D-like protein